MSSETIDTLTLNIYDLGKTMQSLTQRAELEYSAEVDVLIQTNCRDSVRIERLLDGILDFCFDADMVPFVQKTLPLLLQHRSRGYGFIYKLLP